MSPDPAVEAWRDAHAAHARRLLEQAAAEQGIGPIEDVAAWMESVAAPEDIPTADLEAWGDAIREARGGDTTGLLDAARTDERERVAAGLDRCADFYDRPEVWPEESRHPDSVAAHAMHHAYRTAARLTRQRQLPGDEPVNDDKEP